MEMWMGSHSFYQHLHLNPPPSPSSGQEAISSSYYCYPPYTSAAAMTNNNKRDADVDPTATPPPLPQSRIRAAARKDRHSKICTAGGMRDRRMRLSLDVARRFFSLQDKLGFDKASKTVQWLLDMSTAGINHLLAASETSMSEDGSGSVLLDSDDHIMVIDAETNNCKMPTKARRRAGRKSKNGAPAPVPDKESRARARQRARDRTIQRSRLRLSTLSSAEEAPTPAAIQVIPPVIPPESSSSFGSYYEEQEPWELGGVVFAKPRFH
ncbi:hypothetical protein QYE76_001745 [Lolium multiflorum]|uniref:Uncharacterized protein n=1 Tax=Lolium multiflorum TaxID=4521 RepID=A0AAD8RMC9_LOLMU|nr:hypothetical protein QYE76_001745 [Lolium multiflorum]